jgi:uncharacterized protein YdaU (DUF1376 family)
VSGKPDSFMPFYTGDWLRSTGHLKAAEHGAYLLLVLHYWDTQKPLTSDEEDLRRIARMTRREWNESRERILSFFELIDKKYHHFRVEKEITRASEKYKARSENGAKAANKRWQTHANGMPDACQTDANHNHTPTEKNPSGSSSDRRAKGNARAPKGAAPPSPVSDWADDYPEWKAFKSSIHPTEWANWFANARPNGSTASLVAETPFQRDEVAARYLSRLLSHFGEHFVLKTKEQKGPPQ